jgi:hypothetical protein
MFVPSAPVKPRRSPLALFFVGICSDDRLGASGRERPDMIRAERLRACKPGMISIIPRCCAACVDSSKQHEPAHRCLAHSSRQSVTSLALFEVLLHSSGGHRTAADNQTFRNVFVVGPDKKIQLVLVYPMSTGRNFDEVLRVIDSLQLTAKRQGRYAGQLAAGRGRHHLRLGDRRGRHEEISARLEDSEAITSESCDGPTNGTPSPIGSAEFAVARSGVQDGSCRAPAQRPA